jgi:threonine dehydratase/serine racemase
VDRSAVLEAAARIAPFVEHTPVLRDGSFYVKAEHLQRAGAFKYRGATNAVQSLSDADARRGIAAHSSGNHAAALALAASVRGIPAHVVMPRNTSSVKVAAVEAYGARITYCDNNLGARRETLTRIVAETGAIEIHPFENSDVIAGAGTAALELLEEVGDLDVIVVPIGGGGLASGTCLAAPGIRIIGGHPVDRNATIADGLRTGTSSITDAMLDAYPVERIAIPEDAITAAMAQFDGIEPSAAVAFAAARAADLTGQRVGIISSGGNITKPAP